MNLLIGFVILLCLVCSEVHPAEFATDLWTRICLVAAVSLAVPGLALFQTMAISKRMRNQELDLSQHETIMRRVSVCHSAVWLTASLAIIWAIRWQDVVRGNWNLDRWPLLDEIMLLAPVVLSLVASWIIFYENQRSFEGTRTARLKWKSLKQRFSFVAIRFQVYFLMILIPIAITILARDLNPWLSTFSFPIQFLAYSVSGLSFAVAFPFLLLLIWKNESAPPGLQAGLIQTCKEHNLRVFDIRIWDTGGRIMNAVVAGVVPWFRVILISDRMIDVFPRSELLAVVRHEAGHLRLWHLPIRIGFTVLPLITFGLDQQSYLSFPNILEAMAARWKLPPGTGIGCFVALYIGYLLIVLPRIAHRMEFEADLYSCFSPSRRLRQSSIIESRIVDMANALKRLASHSPEKSDHRTMLHPSIRERIERLREIQDCPTLGQLSFDKSIRHQRLAAGLLIAGLLISVINHCI